MSFFDTYLYHRILQFPIWHFITSTRLDLRYYAWESISSSDLKTGPRFVDTCLKGKFKTGFNLFLGVSKDDTVSNASSCHSPASSEAGGIYPQELVENFALNLHR